MRKAIVLLAVVVAVVVCGIAASKLRATVAERAPTFASEFAAKIGGRVEIGKVSVSYFPPAAEVRDVRVSARAGSVQPFLVIDKVRVFPTLRSLLAGGFAVKSVSAKRPSFQYLAHDRDGRLASVLPDRWLQALAAQPFSLEVRDGTVLLENRTSDPPATTLRVVGVHGSVRGGEADGLRVDLTGAPLGEGSSGRFFLRLEPGVGPTGGDAVEIELDVHRGSAAALKGAFLALQRADLRDPVQFSLRAEGYHGERSTESAPAKPLLGTLRGSMGVEIAGRDERLDLDLNVALDDSRYQVRSGKGSWGEFRFQPTAWLARGFPHKMSVKVDVEPFVLEDTAARFGAPERWRPRGRVEQFTLRVTGQGSESLIRYEAKLPKIEFAAWPQILPIEAAPVVVRGSTLAVNTDLSASFGAQNLRIANARIDHMIFGVAYWKEKLSATSLDTPLYGGMLHAAFAFFPKVSSAVTGGALLRDADAATVFANAAPNLPVRIGGRFDGSMQLGADEDGTWMRARVGVHRGRIDGANWARELVSGALTTAGASDSIGSFINANRPLLGAEATVFERMAVDVETRGGVVSLPRVVVDLSGAQLRGRGEIGVDGAVSLDAALWPDERTERALLETAPAFGRARDAAGEMVLPCAVRLTTEGAELSLTPDAASALGSGEAAHRDLTPVIVSPARFGDLPPLRQQFGR